MLLTFKCDIYKNIPLIFYGHNECQKIYPVASFTTATQLEVTTTNRTTFIQQNTV